MLPQQSGPTLNGIERRTQLVGQCCQELILDVAESLGFGARVALGLQQLLTLGVR